jgi:RNA polymerase sigma-70 factor, ECF subfamily
MVIPGSPGVLVGMPGSTDFEEFYAASYGRVLALVATMLGDKNQAEDIAQEAFARALMRWHRVAAYDVPEAWVRRVAMRLTVDAGRRATRALHVLRVLGASGAGAGAGGDLSDWPALNLALLKVPIRQRQALVLYYLADLPVDVIARDCGVPERTIRSRLAAGRHRLESELREHPEEAHHA